MFQTSDLLQLCCLALTLSGMSIQSEKIINNEKYLIIIIKLFPCICNYVVENSD